MLLTYVADILCFCKITNGWEFNREYNNISNLNLTIFTVVTPFACLNCVTILERVKPDVLMFVIVTFSKSFIVFFYNMEG